MIIPRLTDLTFLILKNPQRFLANTFPKPFLIGYKLLKEGLGQSKAF
jgi:hypothetical protein